MTYDYSQHDQDYDDHVPEAPLEPPPVGKYVCEITSAAVKMNDRSGYPELRIAAKIMTGEHTGKMCFPSANYHPDFIKYLRQMVERLGYRGKGSGIPDAAAGFVGAKVEIAVVQKGQYTNYYLNRRLDDLYDPPPLADDGEEEIPFD